MLTVAAARLCGYQSARADHVKLAACVEFIHSATLLHDDVVDRSGLRRGKPSANAVWGDKASVLVGDFLFTRAFELMVEVGSLDTLGVLSPETASRYVSRLASRTPFPRSGRGASPTRFLTPREREVLLRLARDETLWAIACDLRIAHATVRNHVQHILTKLGVHSIAEAVALSLIEPWADNAGPSGAPGRASALAPVRRG